MSEDTTKTSNDESRKEATVKHVSESEIQKHIENWGKVYIAAINPEFAVEVLNHTGGDTLEIKVENKASKYIEELKQNSMDIGAKPVKTENSKRAREVAKKQSEKRAKKLENGKEDKSR